MASIEDWIKHFTRFRWSCFVSCVETSCRTRNKITTLTILLYALFEGIRLSYVSKLQDLESALMFASIFTPFGLPGRMFMLTGGILMLESFVLQSVVKFSSSSLISLNPYMTQENRALFRKESKLIFKISYWSMYCIIRFFQVLAVTCVYLYVNYFSFSFLSFFFSLVACILATVNLEFIFDIYMYYWIWFVSARKLSYAIDSLFKNNSSSVHLDTFIQVCHQCKFLNQLSQKLSITCFVFGVVLNIALILTVDSFVSDENPLPLFVVVLVTLMVITIFIGRLIYFIGAANPLLKSTFMRDRVYGIFFSNKNLSWRERRQLLNVVKSQTSLRTRMALTTIDGSLLETKLLGYHIVYSLRALVLLLKITKP